MRKTVLFLAITVSAVALYLLWHRSPAESAGAAPAGEPIIVTDFAGREVAFHRPIRRIVLLRSFDIYDVAPLLGDDLPAMIVGWDAALETGDRQAYLKFVERFPQLKEIAVLGDSLRGSIDPEAVLALRPDLVITNVYMLERGIDTVNQLDQLGVPLLFLNSDNPLHDPQENIRLLGKVLGREERAAEVAGFIDSHLADVFARLENLRGPQPSVYLEAGGAPDRLGNSYGADPAGLYSSWGSILSQLKCRNIAEGRVLGMSPLDPEYVLAADPTVIVETGAHWTDNPASIRLGYGADPREAVRRLRAFSTRPGWSELSAVRNGRLHGIHMRFANNATSFLAAEQLAKWLYPQAFSDLDPLADLKEFHDRFMPVSLSGAWMVSAGPLE